MSADTCRIPGCDKPRHARGWCSRHYTNWYRRGHPEHEAPPRGGERYRRPIDPATRFWSKVDFSDPDGCWPWKGSYRHAYGEFWLNGTKAYAHRVAALLVFGALPDDSVVLHRCDNPACVRPDHLGVGDQTANMRDCSEKGRWRNQFAAGPNADETPARERYRKAAS